MSMLDKYNLDNDDAKETFESLVGTGATLKEIAIIFGVTYGRLNQWVFNSYGMQMEAVYERLRHMFFEDYKELLGMLAARGNPTAISTLNQYVHKMGDEQKTVKIQVVSNVNPDTDADADK